MTSLNFNYFHKGPASRYSHPGGWAFNTWHFSPWRGGSYKQGPVIPVALICQRHLNYICCSYCLVTQSSLRPHGLQRSRLPYPSQSPRVCSNSRPLSWWCHPTISSSVIPFSSCLQSFQASGSFPMSWLFTSGGQSIRASASESVLPMNIQGWFPWCPRDSQESSPAPQFELHIWRF